MSSINMRFPSSREEKKTIEYHDSQSCVAAFGTCAATYVNKALDRSEQ